MANSTGAVVVDANVLIATVTFEQGRDAAATRELSGYTARGYELYAPGVVFAEALFVICNKLQRGNLTATEHSAALQMLETIAPTISPPPSGDSSLIRRAEQIRASYGCSRSADGLYIALAEELAQSRPTVILTFDQGMPAQIAKNAPSVTVKLL
jgi:predicted nucleic acid-binding protein